MARSRTYRKKRRMRTVRKRYVSSLGYVTDRGQRVAVLPKVYRTPVGLPERYKCKLKYNTIVTLNPSPAFAVNAFRANSLFDPDLTGVGHQPTPFDQMASFYKKYFVIGAKFIMTPIRSVGDVFTNGYHYYGMTLQPTSGITAGLTWDDMMQSEKTTQRIHVFATTGSDSSPAKMTGPIKLYYSAKKYYGQGYNDQEYKALVTANPTSGPVVDCWAISPTASDPNVANYNIYIEYIAIFSDPQTIGIS